MWRPPPSPPLPSKVFVSEPSRCQCVGLSSQSRGLCGLALRTDRLAHSGGRDRAQFVEPYYCVALAERPRDHHWRPTQRISCSPSVEAICIKYHAKLASRQSIEVAVLHGALNTANQRCLTRQSAFLKCLASRGRSGYHFFKVRASNVKRTGGAYFEIQQNTRRALINSELRGAMVGLPLKLRIPDFSGPRQPILTV